MTTEIHMSIDIETLSVDPHYNAAVIAIGAVTFTKHDILDELEILIDPILTPGARGQETLEWWNKQDAKIRERMFSGSRKPWDACTQFAAFCSLGAKNFWGNPARFDIGHLRQMYAVYGREFPFPFYQERDLSTIKWAVARSAEACKNDIKRIREKNAASHSALEDARSQAEVIQYCMGVIDFD